MVEHKEKKTLLDLTFTPEEARMIRAPASPIIQESKE
jgi:hypothetical protein